MTDPAVKACNEAARAINALWVEIAKAVATTEKKINDAWRKERA
jgi:hypothetical protein